MNNARYWANNARNPDMMESRKWGVYCIANLQFKTYFKVDAPLPLCSGLQR